VAEDGRRATVPGSHDSAPKKGKQTWPESLEENRKKGSTGRGPEVTTAESGERGSKNGRALEKKRIRAGGRRELQVRPRTGRETLKKKNSNGAPGAREERKGVAPSGGCETSGRDHGKTRKRKEKGASAMSTQPSKRQTTVKNRVKTARRGKKGGNGKTWSTEAGYSSGTWGADREKEKNKRGADPWEEGWEEINPFVSTSRGVKGGSTAQEKTIRLE